ncbi:MAG: SDR family oxidoreductase [Victivallaceae bacterium]|nr:SDR family oxidoreductase [Victivallaceae bacterium]
MDKVIIITGATSGFGEAMVEKFGNAGCKLVLVARTQAKLDATVEQINAAGGEAVAVCGDVTKSGTFEKVLAVALEKFGRLDVLINNAGGGIKIAPIEEMDDASIRSCLDLNLNSVIKACRIIVPQMKKQKSGLIINLTSACAKFAWPEWSVYSAAKAGLSMLSRCLHAELRPFGIGVSVIVPGGSNTGFQKKSGIDTFEWNEENALRPEHIADAAFSIVNMPQGGFVPEMVVYGMEQEVIPF